MAYIQKDEASVGVVHAVFFFEKILFMLEVPFGMVEEDVYVTSLQNLQNGVLGLATLSRETKYAIAVVRLHCFLFSRTLSGIYTKCVVLSLVRRKSYCRS